MICECHFFFFQRGGSGRHPAGLLVVPERERERERELKKEEEGIL